MKRTLRERFLRALLARGERQEKLLSGCIVVTRSAGGHYYLGTSGGLRYGATRGGSLPAGSKFRQSLLDEEALLPNGG